MRQVKDGEKYYVVTVSDGYTSQDTVKFSKEHEAYIYLEKKGWINSGHYSVDYRTYKVPTPPVVYESADEYFFHDDPAVQTLRKLMEQKTDEEILKLMRELKGK